MKIESVKQDKKYTRNIEGMGKGLVFFEVIADTRRSGQNYHLFYEDRQKPPLDIAINPDDNTIEYTTYFIQKQKMEKEEIHNEIDYQEGIAVIYEENFNEDYVHKTQEGRFKNIISKNDIFILSEFSYGKKIKAYRIDTLNYLLFYHEIFCGLLLKDITDEEWNEIIRSQCI